MSRIFLAAIGLAAFALSAGSARSVQAAEAPDYTVITLHADVNRTPADVWKRVGGYCAISEWLKATCKYLSGSGGVGTVRVINGTNVEPMVGKTDLSYTYWQTEGNMAPFSYHGTLAVRSAGQGRSELTYTLFYNQAALASDGERAAQHARLTSRFQTALNTMKALAESGQ